MECSGHCKVFGSEIELIASLTMLVDANKPEARERVQEVCTLRLQKLL